MFNFFWKTKIRNIHLYQLIIFLMIDVSNNYIVLPFKLTNTKLNINYNAVNEADEFLSELNKNQIYSVIPFGNPEKNLEVYLSNEKSISAVLTNFCREGTPSSYDPNYSNNFKNISKDTFSFDNIKDAMAVGDICSFYTDANLTGTKIIDTFQFILGNNTAPVNKNVEVDKYCGTIGLMQNPNEYYLFAKNIIIYLKDEKIIDSYSWGMFFFDKESYYVHNEIQNKYDGLYIAGINEEDYPNIFKTSNVKSTYTEGNKNIYKFDKIFFYESSNNKKEYLVSNDTLFEFYIDNNYIISGMEYYNIIKEYFFKKYLDNKVCLEKTTSPQTYGGINYMIICESSFKNDIKSFPTLYFYNRELSFNFNLDYNDVFFELDDKIYFLILGKEMYTTVWSFGKLFMKKYPFIFNQDKKRISFVHFDKYDKNSDTPNESKDDDNNKQESGFWSIFKIILLIILLIIVLIVGIIIGRVLWKKRKIRVNELKDEDDYDYTINQNDN